MKNIVKVKKFGPGSNHHVITEKTGSVTAYCLQSYDSIIAQALFGPGGDFIRLILDGRTWDYSRTTAKHRNAFMDRYTPWRPNDTNSTTKRISAGDILLDDLNAPFGFAYFIGHNSFLKVGDGS